MNNNRGLLANIVRLKLGGVFSVLAVAWLLVSCEQNGDQKDAKLAAQSCVGLTGSEMVWIPGGEFTMGESPRYGEEGPPENKKVSGFWMDVHEVTNAEFAQFVKATGYKTSAERNPPKFDGAPPEMLLPGSAVFSAPTQESRQWWRWVVGAQWRNPNGPADTIIGKDRDPVVQITYQDALAYALWAGKELPTEAQWEFAARAGGDALPEPVDQQGKPQANYYQGVFPVKDLASDGYVGRAPVGCFPPNAYGLYDMIGNVWEWTNSNGSRPDAGEPVQIIKGGSYLCAANYCARYRPAARQFQEQSLGTDHIGFRLIDNRKDAPESK